MQLTAQDKRAAREGFKYVVVRAGERVCYTTSLGEAKRECGKSGKIVAISGMRYTAKNPSSGAKQRARGTRKVEREQADYGFYGLNLAAQQRAEIKRLKDLEKKGIIKWAPVDDYEPSEKQIEWERTGHKAALKMAKIPSRYVTGSQHQKRVSVPLPNPSKALTVVRLMFDNGGSVITSVKGSQAAIKHKYVGKAFNLQHFGLPVNKTAVCTGVAFLNPSAAKVGHVVGKHAKYAARGAKRVGKEALAGAKSFFGSAYKSFKKTNPRKQHRLFK